ncbi:MAG TPA: acyl dehydratase, partial [Mycobacterium sp.]
MDQDLTYPLAFGSYEDALAMVGTAGQPRIAATPVSGARIQLFAAMVRDGNR